MIKSKYADATEGGLFSDVAENNPGDLLLEDFVQLNGNIAYL